MPSSKRHRNAKRRAKSLRLESLESRQMLTGVPIISEFMARNSSVTADEDGNFTDWIEVANPDSVPLDLAGWHLTDDVGRLNRWTFPAGASLAPGEHLVVRASGLDRFGTGPGGEYHTNFKLGGGGEYLALVQPNGQIAQEFVSNNGEFPPQVDDVSYGLVTGTTNETYFLSPTPGAVNSGPTSDNPAQLQRVVINEIMYHPDSSGLLAEAEEYIELFNNDTNAVDLSGWEFTSGVKFVFPAGASLAAGEYLVVAADTAAFHAKYPTVTASVYGDWQGRLGNGSETIDLENASGDLIDTVTYADEGNWAQRIRGPNDLGFFGWLWDAPHDAGGSSLELINPDVTNDHGQNWAASRNAQGAPNQGTPGQVNSAVDSDIAPLISDVQQSIVIPDSSQAVTITARVSDESTTAVNMSLFYRLDGNTGAFTEVAMADDGVHGDGGIGDRVFGATIPPQADGAIVEFFVRATDVGLNLRTWPAAALQFDQSLAQTANALYQVDDSFTGQTNPGDQPVIYAIMTESERADLATIGSSSATAESNAQMNGTFIMVDETGVSIRYTAGMRNRGSTSRRWPPNNLRINIPSDRPWNGTDKVTINAKETPSQALGGVIYPAAGLVAEDIRAIQLRVNGNNLGNNDPSMFSTYVQIEPLDGDFADNHFPGDGNGNLYAVRDSDLEQGDLRYEGTNPDAYRDTYFKKTNEELDDWTDIIGLTDALNNATDANFFTEVSAVADLEQWFRFFAADTLLLNTEGGLPWGIGDDYTLYRGLNDTRFVIIPHDLDTLLDGGTASSAADSDVGTERSLYQYEKADGLARLFTHPDTVGLYYKYLLELANTVFAPEQFGNYVDQVLGDWVSPQVVQNFKQTAALRRAYVLSEVPTQLTVSSSLDLAGDTQIHRTSSSTEVGLSGEAHAGSTRSVLVNGVAADWNPRTGWSLSFLPTNSALNPGLNRLVVQAFDGSNGSGALIDTRSIDVWYETVSSVTLQQGVNSYVGMTDTWISQNTGNRDSNFGNEPTIAVDGLDPLETIGLLRWDLTSTVPTGSVVNDVSMTVNVGNDSAGQIYEIYAANRAWWESEATWNNSGTGTPWGTPGARGAQDRGSVVLGTLAPELGSYALTLNAAGVAVVQGWVNDPATNHGFIISDKGNWNGFEIDSSENATIANRPQLSISYSSSIGFDPVATSSVDLTVRDSYLSSSDVLVRVELLDANGEVDRDIWDATATLTTDNPAISLSSNQVGLVNGMGSVLVTINSDGGDGNFTLTASVGSVSDSQTLTNLDASGQTMVSGDQSGTWSGIVNVTGDVNVPFGQKLTIAPGTLVILDGDPVGAVDSTQITIEGTLLSEGTALRPVTLTSTHPDNPWGGIIIDGGDATLRNSVVTRAGNTVRVGHTLTGPAFRLQGNGTFEFVDSSVANIHGKILQSTSGEVTFTDSLLTRAVMGPEVNDTSLDFDDTWIVEMNSDWHYDNFDDDHDGIYLHSQQPGQDITLSGGVVAMIGDDGIDTLGGEVTTRDMIVRNIVDKGYSVAAGWVDIENSLIVDADIGIATKSDGTREPQVAIDHTTIARTRWGIAMLSVGSGVVYDIENTIIHVNPQGNPLVRGTLASADRFHVNYSLFDAAWTTAGSGVGNIQSDLPLFVDLAGNDFRLDVGSLAIDSGNPSSALDDDGTRADMGAFRTNQQQLPCDYVGGGNGCNANDIAALYAGTNGAPTPLTNALINQWLVDASDVANPLKSHASDTYVHGDVNLDGDVNSPDLGLLLNNFNDNSGVNWSGGNLNSDAVVNSADLGMVLNNFNYTSATSQQQLPCDYVGGGDGCDANDIAALYAGANGAPTPLTNALISQWLVDASDAANPLKSDASDIYVYGDVNLDGEVKSPDLGLLLNNFNGSSAMNWNGGNLNIDATVDSTDLGLLLNQFNFASFAFAAGSATTFKADSFSWR